MSTSNEHDEPLKPWDQQPGEGGRAYAAFSLYLSLGVNRSLNKAYQKHQANVRGESPDGAFREPGEVSLRRKTATGRWNLWSQTYHWKDRAEAYDASLESERRKIREDEHFGQLRAHLDRQRQVAIALNGTALRMLQLVQEELRAQPNQDVAPGRHTLTPTKLPAYARTAGVLARIALEAEGDALGVEEILGNLDEQTS